MSVNGNVLQNIMAFKGVWALCDVSKATKRLKATHYAACLIYGPRPVWGVWTVAGRFQRFFAARSDIEGTYPRLVWRMKAASWALLEVEEYSVKRKIQMVEEKYHQKVARKSKDEAKS